MARIMRPDAPPASAPAPAATFLAGVAALLIAAAAIHAAVLPWETGDVRLWFVPWLDHIVAHGVRESLARPMQVQVEGAANAANYNPPYLYLLAVASLGHGAASSFALVKAVSVAGTVFCAGAVLLLLREFLPWRPALLGAAVVLVLPSVVFNGPLWGQTDAVWAGLDILAVVFALRGRWAAMAVAFGLALAFKLQAIFIAPFLLYMLLSRRAGLFVLLLVPLAYAAALVPAWLAGRPAFELATIYLEQANSYRQLSMNAPNPWAFVQALRLLDYETGVPVGLAATALAGLALSGLGLRWRLEGRDLLLLAVIVAAAMPYLLPKMHDRYFFLADLLAFALAWAWPRRWTLSVAAMIQLGSVCAYAAHLWEFAPARFLGALAIGLALAIALHRLGIALRAAAAARSSGVGHRASMSGRLAAAAAGPDRRR